MRIISRLDIKNEFVIKGINLEGLRKVGNPIELASKYYNENIDEIIYVDAVASLYRRNTLSNLIYETSKKIFVPLTVGGGIRSHHDIEKALRLGADKVSLNSYATENPDFIAKSVKNFGSSTIVIYIETKYNPETMAWEVYKYSGRERSGIKLFDWIDQIQNMECGEIMLTSIDYEGTQQGFDMELIKKVIKKIKVPLIISGGCGEYDHVLNLKKEFKNVSVALASALHYNNINIKKLKEKIE
jgi:cyclase